MKFTETHIPNLYVIDLDAFSDDRGWFARTYCAKEFAEIGMLDPFVQLNHSFNSKKGTLRGMHFQNPPFEEVKMVRCIAGRVFDVVVDLRKNSLTFQKWFGIELSAKNRKMILIPKGFAHGFLTLEDASELIYHHTQFYMTGADNGINHMDPMIKINWPEEILVVSEKDSQLPYLKPDFTGI